jgi:hypothetical protein
MASASTTAPVAIRPPDTVASKILRIIGKAPVHIVLALIGVLWLVPTRIYFSGAHAKTEIALARGKDLYDKRQSMRERESKRDMERAVREARR